MTEKLLRFAAAILFASAPALAQKHELGLTLGRLAGQTRGPVESKSGTGLQANYGVRVTGDSRAALFAEVHFLASQQRKVTGPPPATRDYASLYVTPGIRVKLSPEGRVQPWGAIGAGYALYEHSTLTIGGAANPAPRHSSHGAFYYGVGLDVPVKGWLALRGEARDFYTPSPAYNVGNRGRQHNVVIGGGFVLRFGE